MGQRGQCGEQAELKKPGGRRSLSFDAEKGVASQEAEEREQRIGASFLAQIDLQGGDGHQGGGDQSRKGTDHSSQDVEQHDDSGEGCEGGEGPRGDIGGAEQVDPPAEEDEIDGGMDDAAETGPDMPPGGRSFQTGWAAAG